MDPELPHPGLAWCLGDEDGRRWLARLPGLVADCVERWGLTLEDPFPDAHASLAIPATRPDGSRAVLKVQVPDREGRFEAEALRRWEGVGAVRLLDHDPVRRALLLERAEPGLPLSTIDPSAALDVLAGLLARSWVEADRPFIRLEDEARWWASTLRSGDPAREVVPGRTLVEAAVAAIEELVPTQPERVLLHQDLHADNVLSSTREPWLVMDPKPLVGERAFGLAPIVRGHELGHSRQQVIHRLDTLSERLGVDRERARRWTIAQTVAWCADRRHLDVAGWLLDA